MTTKHSLSENVRYVMELLGRWDYYYASGLPQGGKYGSQRQELSPSRTSIGGARNSLTLWRRDQCQGHFSSSDE